MEVWPFIDTGLKTKAEGEFMSEISGVSQSVAGNGLGLGHLKKATTETAPAPSVSGGEPVADDITLSSEAQTFVSGTPATGPGKSHMSTAHRALEAFRENPALADMPFGKIVSTLARTGNIRSLLPLTPPPPPPVEAAVVTPPETSDPATDETDPPESATTAPLSVPPIPLPEIAPEDSSIVELLEAIANPDEGDEGSDITDLFVEDGNDEPETV